MSIPVPLQRSSSGGAAFVGPVPRSARRWARSAYLHEVRRARHHQHQHQQHHHGGTNLGTDVDEDVFAAAPADKSAPVAGSFWEGRHEQQRNADADTERRTGC